MTERQVLLLYEAEIRRRRRERSENLSDINLAFAGGDAATARFKELQD